MKQLLSDFKDFVNRGNVIDLAVGIIIGSAFTSIVSSLVSDIITPLLSPLTGDGAFADWQVSFAGITLNLGNFLNACVQFLIIAFAVFLMVKGITHAQQKLDSLNKTKQEQAPHCPFCLEEVKEGATRCPHCAAAFDEPLMAPVDTSEETKEALTGILKRTTGKVLSGE